MPDPTRSPILSLRYKTLDSLAAAYMPFIENGGLFLPDQQSPILGKELFVLLMLPKVPQALACTARVIWLTPAQAEPARCPGYGIQFRDSNRQLQSRIEQVLSNMDPGKVASLTLCAS